MWLLDIRTLPDWERRLFSIQKNEWGRLETKPWRQRLLDLGSWMVALYSNSRLFCDTPLGLRWAWLTKAQGRSRCMMPHIPPIMQSPIDLLFVGSIARTRRPSGLSRLSHKGGVAVRRRPYARRYRLEEVAVCMARATRPYDPSHPIRSRPGMSRKSARLLVMSERPRERAVAAIMRSRMRARA